MWLKVIFPKNIEGMCHYLLSFSFAIMKFHAILVLNLSPITHTLTHTYTHTHTHTHTHIHTQPQLELLEAFCLFWVILHDDMILFQKFIIVGTLCSLPVLSLWPLHSGRFLIKALIISSLSVSLCSHSTSSDIVSP